MPASSRRRTKPGRLTIVSWNVENLARYLSPGKGDAGESAAPDLAQVAAQLGDPQLLCVQEVRIRPADHELVARARSALSGHDCELCLCRDTKNANFRGGRVYGVATYVKKDMHVVHRTLEWDLEGRVLITLLPREQLAVVNVYAVNGTDKPHYDHDLGRVEGDRHAFKRRFNQRLMQDCVALKREGLELVLIGDWNISRTALDTFPRLRSEPPHALARKLFNERFIPGLGVVDIWRHLRPEARAYTWFNHVARDGALDAARVDFALVSESLVDRVEGAGVFADSAQRFLSDHAPLYVTLRA